MTITFEYWKDGRGITLRDEGLRFQFFHSEAIQVRDEFNQRYPLSGAELDALGRPSVVAKKPTPAPLSLEVGKWYLRRDGRKVRIVSRDLTNGYPFTACEGTSYTTRGVRISLNCLDPLDLIAETTAPGVMEMEGCGIGDGSHGVCVGVGVGGAGGIWVDGVKVKSFDGPMGGGSLGVPAGLMSGAKEQPLTIGDTVRLKSGGPVMTVVAFYPNGDVYLAYEEEGKIAHNTYPPAALVRAKP